MADIVSFTVALINKVSGPAAAATASMQGLQHAATATVASSQAVNAAWSRQWGVVAAEQAESARREIERMSAAGRAARQAVAFQRAGGLGDWMGLARANTALGALGRFRAGLSGMAQSVKLLGSAQDDATRKVAGESFAESFGVVKTSWSELAVLGGPVVGVVTAVGGALLTVAKYAAMAAAAVAAVGVAVSVAFAKAVGQMAMVKENAIATFNALAGGKGVETFERIKKSASDLAVPIEDATEGIRALTAAGFKGDDAFRWFARMQDLSAIGVTSETMSRVVLAMSQIKGAGKLQGDELRQLQETGLNLDLIWQNISKEMGVSVQQAMKLKEEGKVTADVALRGIEAAIIAMTGSAEAGGARIRWLSTTVAGSLAQLKSSWSQALLKIAELAEPAFKRLKPVMDGISAWLNSDAFTEWAKRGATYFGFLVESMHAALGAALAFVDGFTGTLGTEFDRLAKQKNPLDALKDPAVLKQIKDFGTTIGKATIDLGRFVAWVGATAAAVSAWVAQNETLMSVLKWVGIALAAIVGCGLIAFIVAAIGFFTLLSPFIAAVAGVIYVLVEAVQWAIDLWGSFESAAAKAWATLKAVAIDAIATVITELNRIPFVNIPVPKVSGTPVAAGGAAAASTGAGVSESVRTTGGVDVEYMKLAETHAAGGPVGPGGGVVGEGEWVVPKGGALVLRGGAEGGGAGKTFQANFNIIQQSGEDGDAFARRVLGLVQSWWEGQALAEGT